ncbi:MAG: hypothetical protein V1910_01465 [bacterium]
MKKISLLLIISIISINFSFLIIPKKVEAQMVVSDPGAYGFFTGMNSALGIIAGTTGSSATANVTSGIWETIGKYTLEGALAALAKQTALALIKQITDATVDWINNGFEGDPAYIADFDKFLTGEGGVTDQAIGEFFQNSDLNFLCEPFQIQVKLALQLGLGVSAGLRNKIGCTLSKIERNIENAYQNSNITTEVEIKTNGKNTIIGAKGSVGGGWNEWLNTTLQPQNNPIGAYLIAKAELDTQIKEKKDAKTFELFTGQGALTFSKCIDTYYVDGVQYGTPSIEYTKGAPRGNEKGNRPNLPLPPVNLHPMTFMETKTKCTVKTPGSIITSMLSSKANSTKNVSELQAAMANGIDSIIGALLNALINVALEEIKEGILDDNHTSITSQVYTNLLNNATTTIIDIYNSTTTPWDWLNNSTTTENITEEYNGLSPLDYAKNNANSLIGSLLKSELTYQNNYKIAQKVLIQAKTEFASSSVCNINYNRPDCALRAVLIRSNVLTNIEGVPDSDRTIASIPWNLEIIKTALKNSEANVDILDKASSGVSSAGSLQAVTDAMIPVNSTSFNTDPKTKMIEEIKIWLGRVGVMYNSFICPINLDEILKIESL